MSLTRNALELAGLFFVASAMTLPAHGENLTVSRTAEDWPVKNVRVIAMPPSIFTRMPVTETVLKQHGCRFETASPDIIQELKQLISRNIAVAGQPTHGPEDVRTAIYLDLDDGTTYRYLLQIPNLKKEMRGDLTTTAGMIPVLATNKLLKDLKNWAGPDTPLQKFSDTCLANLTD